MTLTERASYIKGLADGCNLDKNSECGKLVAALIDLTADMAAEIADMVVLENILAYQLYDKDIEITVQGTNDGEAVDVTFTYNLATYVDSGVSGEVGTALYAYAKEAYAYGYKHSIGTIE